MALSIQNNIASLNAQNNLARSQSQLQLTMDQLSSGDRITSASVDAAGLGISNTLEAQIKSYTQASRNANDGISLVQTAEGGMNSVQNILSRLRSLAMESASDGVGSTQRTYINNEATQLKSELDRISSTAEYNGTKLLDGTKSQLSFQVGIRSTDADAITVGLSSSLNMSSAGLSVSSVDLTTIGGATQALASIDAAMDTVSNARANMGAFANRFQSVIDTIASSSQNLSAADSRLRDVDVAAASSDLAREQVKTQAGIAVVAQANQQAQSALKLLG